MQYILILNDTVRITVNGTVRQASIKGKKHFLLTIFHGEKEHVCVSKTLQPFSEIGSKHHVYESREDYMRGCNPLHDVKLVISGDVKLKEI